MAARLNKAERPFLSIEGAKRPDIGVAVVAGAVSREPRERACVGMAYTTKGERRDMAASV
jgi:hypothetical protein